MTDRNCPCGTCEVVKDLKEETERQSREIVDCQIKFASINAKLNAVIGILAVIGTAVLGVAVNLMFG